jgi:general secretion pathway protein L
VDFRSLAGLARRGLAWWVGELSALAPPGWRDRLSGRPAVLAEPLDAGGWRFSRRGRAVDGDPFGRGARKAVALVLPESAVLIRELASPRMPAEDVRRMVRLDIDRLSPMPPEQVHFDVSVVGRDDLVGGQQNLVGLVRRDLAARTVGQAQADGLEPASLGVRAAENPAAPRFDFLPAVLEAAGARAPGAARRYWWGAVAALMVLNIALLVGRDMSEVGKLRDKVDAQRPVVDAALALRRRVEGEEVRRRALVARGLNNEPLRMLDALTEALPKGAWVQHLEWNGKALHIVGVRTADIDIAAALRGSGTFANPRAVGVQGSAGTSRPFDITADARPGPRP